MRSPGLGTRTSLTWSVRVRRLRSLAQHRGGRTADDVAGQQAFRGTHGSRGCRCVSVGSDLPGEFLCERRTANEHRHSVP